MTRRQLRSLTFGENLDEMLAMNAGVADLVYMDPPFNSGRSYEAILGPRSLGSKHRQDAFDDQWTWSESAEKSLSQAIELSTARKASLLIEVIKSLGKGDNAAYLAMMTPRLLAAYRLLSKRGSLYVHCDPSASHYLKVILDQIFGPENFRNEIIWKRTHAHSSAKRYAPVHDVILYYSRSGQYIWNPNYVEYQRSYIEKYFTNEDKVGRFQLITCTGPGDRTGTKAHYEWKGLLPPPGRHWAWKKEQMEAFEKNGRLVHSGKGIPRLKRYVHDGAGVPMQDIWTDINRLDAHSDERVGYDTQKPLALLERIIFASTNEGSLVIDPFCGTGTTLVAAEKLKRHWAGIDVSLLAGSLSLARVRREISITRLQLKGFPSNERQAVALMKTDPNVFGIWAASMLATLADRKLSTGSLATGTGKLHIASRTLQLLSWVPISQESSAMEATKNSKKLAEMGFFLKTNRSHSELLQKLKEKIQIPIHAVSLKELVDSDSQQYGLSQAIVTAARTA